MRPMKDSLSGPAASRSRSPTGILANRTIWAGRITPPSAEDQCVRTNKLNFKRATAFFRTMKTPVRTWNPRNLWPHYENKNPDSPLHELQAGRSGGNETPIHRQNSRPGLPAGGGAGHGAGQLRGFRQ